MQIKKMEFFEGKNLILLKYVQIGFMKFIFQRMFENQLCWRKINFLKLTLNVEDTCYYVMLNMILWIPEFITNNVAKLFCKQM